MLRFSYGVAHSGSTARSARLVLLASSFSFILQCSRRHQRSAPFRPRRQQTEDQADAAAAAAACEQSPTSSPDDRAIVRLWSRYVKRPRNKMPMHPLHVPRQAHQPGASNDPDGRHLNRLLSAMDELSGMARHSQSHNTDKARVITAQVTESEKRLLIARYASTRWWGPFYRPFQNITDKQIRRGMRICHAVVSLLIIIIVGMLLFMYTLEMDMVAALSETDRADYIHIVMGMRYSDFAREGDAVVAAEDPLGALPPAAMCHLILESCRRKHWHQMDWAVELRTLHPRSPWEEWDYLHLTYWASVYLGWFFTGGGSLFRDCGLNTAERETEAQEKAQLTPVEPQAKPADAESTRRSFWS